MLRGVGVGWGGVGGGGGGGKFSNLKSIKEYSPGVNAFTEPSHFNSAKTNR